MPSTRNHKSMSSRSSSWTPARSAHNTSSRRRCLWSAGSFFCAVVGGAGLSVIGTVVGLSFIYLLGLPVAVLIYCVDRQMIMRSLPLWSSSLVCLVVGGMLSLVLLRFFPLRMGLDRPGV